MHSDFPAGMAEAAGLTRAGRLDEATALIQRLLGGGAAPAPRTDASALPPPATAPHTTAPPAAGRTGLRETLRRLAERAGAMEADTVGTTSVPTPPGARFEAARFVDATGARDYKIYIPANRAGETAAGRPLLVMLHGCTQNPDDFARGTTMNAAAEAAGCIVVYPAQPTSANPNRCWNWFRAEDQSRGAGEPAQIAALTRAVIAAEGVDPARVYVAGLSAGGAAAATLGAEYPELFAAVGVHSGLPHRAARDLPSAMMAMRSGAAGAGSGRPVRTIVFHGDADRTVHPANAAALVAQATAGAGALDRKVEEGAERGRSYSRTVHRETSGRAVCEHWTLRGAGHAWAGGDSAGSHADALGPDASREMLRFFLEA